MKYTVLDKGFIHLDDFYGGEQAVINAARVSHLSAGDEQSDNNLLEFLLKYEHNTPFRFSVFTFHIKLPIFVARQWMRHTTGSDFVEQSGRYTELTDWYIPDTSRFKNVKDSSSDTLQQAYALMISKNYAGYKELLNCGVPKEVARLLLPTATYTQFKWVVNAQALMHFLKLRLDDHAQFEIREYAKVLLNIFKEKMPVTGKVFEEEYLNG